MAIPSNYVYKNPDGSTVTDTFSPTGIKTSVWSNGSTFVTTIYNPDGSKKNVQTTQSPPPTYTSPTNPKLTPNPIFKPVSTTPPIVYPIYTRPPTNPNPPISYGNPTISKEEQDLMSKYIKLEIERRAKRNADPFSYINNSDRTISVGRPPIKEGDVQFGIDGGSVYINGRWVSFWGISPRTTPLIFDGGNDIRTKGNTLTQPLSVTKEDVLIFTPKPTPTTSAPTDSTIPPQLINVLDVERQFQPSNPTASNLGQHVRQNPIYNPTQRYTERTSVAPPNNGQFYTKEEIKDIRATYGNATAKSLQDLESSNVAAASWAKANVKTVYVGGKEYNWQSNVSDYNIAIGKYNKASAELKLPNPKNEVFFTKEEDIQIQSMYSDQIKTDPNTWNEFFKKDTENELKYKSEAKPISFEGKTYDFNTPLSVYNKVVDKVNAKNVAEGKAQEALIKAEIAKLPQAPVVADIPKATELLNKGYITQESYNKWVNIAQSNTDAYNKSVQKQNEAKAAVAIINSTIFYDDNISIAQDALNKGYISPADFKKLKDIAHKNTIGKNAPTTTTVSSIAIPPPANKSYYTQAEITKYQSQYSGKADPTSMNDWVSQQQAVLKTGIEKFVMPKPANEQFFTDAEDKALIAQWGDLMRLNPASWVDFFSKDKEVENKAKASMQSFSFGGKTFDYNTPVSIYNQNAEAYTAENKRLYDAEQARLKSYEYLKTAPETVSFWVVNDRNGTVKYGATANAPNAGSSDNDYQGTMYGRADDPATVQKIIDNLNSYWPNRSFVTAMNGGIVYKTVTPTQELYDQLSLGIQQRNTYLTQLAEHYRTSGGMASYTEGQGYTMPTGYGGNTSQTIITAPTTNAPANIPTVSTVSGLLQPFNNWSSIGIGAVTVPPKTTTVIPKPEQQFFNPTTVTTTQAQTIQTPIFGISKVSAPPTISPVTSSPVKANPVSGFSFGMSIASAVPNMLPTAPQVTGVNPVSLTGLINNTSQQYMLKPDNSKITDLAIVNYNKPTVNPIYGLAPQIEHTSVDSRTPEQQGFVATQIFKPTVNPNYGFEQSNTPATYYSTNTLIHPITPATQNIKAVGTDYVWREASGKVPLQTQAWDALSSVLDWGAFGGKIYQSVVNTGKNPYPTGIIPLDMYNRISPPTKTEVQTATDKYITARTEFQLKEGKSDGSLYHATSTIASSPIGSAVMIGLGFGALNTAVEGTLVKTVGTKVGQGIMTYGVNPVSALYFGAPIVADIANSSTPREALSKGITYTSVLPFANMGFKAGESGAKAVGQSIPTPTEFINFVGNKMNLESRVGISGTDIAGRVLKHTIKTEPIKPIVDTPIVRGVNFNPQVRTTVKPQNKGVSSLFESNNILDIKPMDVMTPATKSLIYEKVSGGRKIKIENAVRLTESLKNTPSEIRTPIDFTSPKYGGKIGTELQSLIKKNPDEYVLGGSTSVSSQVPNFRVGADFDLFALNRVTTKAKVLEMSKEAYPGSYVKTDKRFITTISQEPKFKGDINPESIIDIHSLSEFKDNIGQPITTKIGKKTYQLTKGEGKPPVKIGGVNYMDVNEQMFRKQEGTFKFLLSETMKPEDPLYRSLESRKKDVADFTAIVESKVRSKIKSGDLTQSEQKALQAELESFKLHSGYPLEEIARNYREPIKRSVPWLASIPSSQQNNIGGDYGYGSSYTEPIKQVKITPQKPQTMVKDSGYGTYDSPTIGIKGGYSNYFGSNSTKLKPINEKYTDIKTNKIDKVYPTSYGGDYTTIKTPYKPIYTKTLPPNKPVRVKQPDNLPYYPTYTNSPPSYPPIYPPNKPPIRNPPQIPPNYPPNYPPIYPPTYPPTKKPHTRKPPEKTPPKTPSIYDNMYKPSRAVGIPEKKRGKPNPWFPASIENVTVDEFALRGKGRATHVGSKSISQELKQKLTQRGISLPTATQYSKGVNFGSSRFTSKKSGNKKSKKGEYSIWE